MQNFIKTIINAVQTWTKKKIKGSTADWNQNDSSADNYVKNRTHWEEEDGTVHKLNSKYLDLPTNLATTDDVQVALDAANAAVAKAATAQTTAINKMNANNPVGTGSFSMNRKVNTTVGTNSHAEGYKTTASGPASHAEGNSTTASGDNSHAEGGSTTASGVQSHAEGGGTVASGFASHAEGSRSIASGSDSHAEGADTIASGLTQHVQGRYNIEDTEDVYAHIVGNSLDPNKRSNAHTLDWSGNAWFQGDVYVGSTSGTNRDEGSKKLATEDKIPTDTHINSLIDTKIAEIPSGGSTGSSTLAVTITDGVASHTSAEIYAHVQSGGTAVLKYYIDLLGLHRHRADMASFVCVNTEERLVTQIDIYEDGSYDEYANIPFGATTAPITIAYNSTTGTVPYDPQRIDELNQGDGVQLLVGDTYYQFAGVANQGEYATFLHVTDDGHIRRCVVYQDCNVTFYDEETVWGDYTYSKTEVDAKIAAIGTGDGDTLTWDGNTEGLVSVDAGTFQFYKISSAIPTMDNFVNGASIVVTDGEIRETGTFNSDEVIALADGIISTESLAFVVIADEAVGVDVDGLVFSEAGVYFFYAPGIPLYPASLTIPGYTGFKVDSIPVPTTAEVGQTIVVTEVDDNGKPTAWECADLPSGGSGGSAFPTTPQLNITVEEEVTTIHQTELDGVPLSDYDFTACYITVATVEQSANTSGEFIVSLNKGDRAYAPRLTAGTSFIKQTTAKHWCGYYNITEGLAYHLAQNGIGSNIWSGNMQTVPCPIMEMEGGCTKIESIRFYANCGIPVGTVIKVWFK